MTKQAFDGKRFTGFWLPPDEIQIVGLDTKDGTEHPLYDERIHLPLDEEFIQNIDRHGIHTPVKVRKNGDVAQCVFGRQRIRAAREVNRRRKQKGHPPLLVPCTKFSGEDQVAMAMGFSENAARKNNDPVQEARDMQRLSAQGYDETEVAIHFCCSKQLVRSRLALLNLAKPVIAEVRSGRISTTAALALKSLSHEEQAEKLKELKESLPSPENNGRHPVRPTQQQVNAAAGRRVRPRAKQIKAMIEKGSLAEASAHDLLRWWVGDLPASKVKGLSAALQSAGLPSDA